LKKEIIKMHNIKRIRNDIEFFTKSLKKRFVDLDIKKIISLDENNRKFINQKEKLEKEKKDISKSKDKSLFEKSKNISIEIEKIGKVIYKWKTPTEIIHFEGKSIMMEGVLVRVNNVVPGRG